MIEYCDNRIVSYDMYNKLMKLKYETSFVSK